MSENHPGTLSIVATPIGNLADITLRAVEILKTVDLIAAEDTRHSKILLQHYGVTTKMEALHDYNENEKSKFLLDLLLAGKNIALISDAGTPLISDPGYHLLRTIKAHAIKVVTIPGACALIAALSIAGLPTDKFIFEGFLPAKASALRARLQELANETRTIVLYESPHRLLNLITALLEVFGENRYVVLAKELTKTFETVYGGNLIAVQKWLHEDIKRQKGEFVILVKGAEAHQITDDEAHRILKILLKKCSVKDAAALTAEITGKNKRELYQKAIELKEILNSKF